MEREEIEAALHELAAEVDRRGIRAKIFVIGGTVMVIVFGSRGGTQDVDSAASDTAVYVVAREVGDRRGLPEGWINDAAKGFIPLAKEPDWRPVLTMGAVEIVAADERTMLAMKMRASRARDLPDIRFLLEECAVTTEDEALAVYEEYFPEDPLEPRAYDVLRAALVDNVEVTGAGALDAVAGAALDVEVEMLAEVAQAQWPPSTRHRGRWLVAQRGRVAHIVRSTTPDHLVITDCGKAFSTAGARMGAASPPVKWCAACQPPGG